MREVGRLELIDPRTIWPDEARDFTPWLVENIQFLSEAIGMDLEVVESEAAVGGLRVDIVCKDLATGRPVVVENILGQTDHDHLGKLLTYAAGQGARAAILVCTDFRDEHLKALEWLNELSGEEHLFFGVKAGVVKIGDSLPAPEFDPVVQPNEWQKEMKSHTSDKQKAYEAFFTRFISRVKEDLPGLTSATKGLPQNYMTFPAGRTGFAYGVSFARERRLRVVLFIDLGDSDKTKAAYDRFLAEKQAIEADFGQGLSWERLEERRVSRIAAYEPGSIDDNPQTLDMLADHAIDLLGRFIKTFRQRIASLSR